MNNTQTTQAAIIGKAWINGDKMQLVPASIKLSQDMELNADESFLLGNLSIRTNRHLNSSRIAGQVAPLTLKAGTVINLFTNSKREGKIDPDYSVNVILSAEDAKTIRDNEASGKLAWQAAQ